MFGTDIESSEMEANAIAEAKKMLLVHHKNIVELFGYSSHLGTAWLFMEYCELGDLHKYLHENCKLRLGKRLDIMYQTTQNVAYLPQSKPPIIHRDIKPENVLMKRKNGIDMAMITDFGFAKLYDYSLSVIGSTIYKQMQGSLRGTPRYMAPKCFLFDETEL